jgi:Pentapeptide repeats (8 copies)
MADERHIELLDKGVSKWNNWCESHPRVRANLCGADLEDYDICGANLFGADLKGAFLGGADLCEAVLTNAVMIGADFKNANLTGVRLNWADASTAIFSKANLTNADLRGTHFCEAKMTGAILQGARMTWADLEKANLSNTDIRGADLSLSRLVRTNFRGADLTGCRVYGCSVWDVEMPGAIQQDLIITPERADTLTVDDLKVAQFIYLMLDNPEVRNVIDTITSRAVLILGRFTLKRKPVLDALRSELRHKGYLPILFDFTKPTSRTLTETVSLLGRMSRFIVADITDAKGIPQELSQLIPFLPSVPVQPLLQKGRRKYAMFEHWTEYPWVLPVYEYESLIAIQSEINQKVIEPAERRLGEYKRARNRQN